MGLIHEATIKALGYQPGAMKIAHYSIPFSLQTKTEPETGWLLANGAPVSRTTYSALNAIYSAAGYPYGSGDGSTTFNLPDLTEGKLPIVKGLTNFTVLGASGGAINVTLDANTTGVHNHGQNITWDAYSHSHGTSATVDYDAGHAHTAYSAAVGGSTRTAVGHSNTNASTGNGTYGTSDIAGGGGVAGTGAHYHSFTLAINANTSSVGISGSLGAAGSSNAHNNMQPYLVVGGWLVRY